MTYIIALADFSVDRLRRVQFNVGGVDDGGSRHRRPRHDWGEMSEEEVL